MEKQKIEYWTISNQLRTEKIKVVGAYQHIWNVVHVPITERVAKRLGDLSGWRASIRYTPRIIFELM